MVHTFDLFFFFLTAEKDFALHDTTGENKYGVDLVQSLRRAKELRGKLLAGQTFYVTPKVPVDTKLLKNVVNACGGHVSSMSFFLFFYFFFLICPIGNYSTSNGPDHNRKSEPPCHLM